MCVGRMWMYTTIDPRHFDEGKRHPHQRHRAQREKNKKQIKNISQANEKHFTHVLNFSKKENLGK